MIIKRTNTILYCDNWSETVGFYEHIIQLPVSHRTDWFIEFALSSDAYLSIADKRRATIKSVAGQGITLAWQVDNIQAMQEMLAERNIPTTPLKQRWGAHVIYFHDPEGHRIELWQPLDE